MEQIPQNDKFLRYYLYRHIRLDKNEPFYIGIGSKRKDGRYNTVKQEYPRAYATSRANISWKNVINKTDYEIEILFESDDYDFIKQKENEFIKLYGRKDLKIGPLCNFTDGGDGTLNIQVSEETRRKLSEVRMGEKNHFYGKHHTEKTKNILSKNNKGRKLSKETVQKRINTIKGVKLDEDAIKRRYKNKNHRAIKAVINFETKEEYYSLAEACRVLNLNYREEKDKVCKKSKASKFYYKGEYFDKYFQPNQVVNIKTGEKYESLQKACDNLGLVYSTEKGKMRRGASIFKKVHEN